MLPTMLPLTPALVARCEACEVAFWAEKLTVLQAIEGNPYGVAVRDFGGATALLASNTNNNGLFNRVGNLGSADLAHLDAILQWYRAHNVKPRFDIIPALGQPDVLHALAGNGLYQSGFYAALYGQLPPAAAETPAITVRAVLPAEADLFAQLYREGFGMPLTESTNYLRDGVRLLIGRPTMHCLLAFVDGTPAAMAILSLYAGTGYLATAATLPQFRRHGCQTALLRARMALADQAGCDVIVGHTGILSASQRNMEQVGMRLAYTKAIWTVFQ